MCSNPTKDTSPWWVGPVPQFWGKPRTFSNPLSCFCHGADPIDGHRKVVGQDQYPALGEVRETAKLLPRGQSPWWRDEGRHLLILCLFSIRGMRLAHMHNAKSREHAHTCRKARAIRKLRYKKKKKKKKNRLSGSLKLDSLPDTLTAFNARNNQFSGGVDLTRLPTVLSNIDLQCNRLSGSVVLTRLPGSLEGLYLSYNQFSGALDLTRLPSSMYILHLNNNSFSGTVDLSELPQGFRQLFLTGNEFSDEGFIPDDVYVENTKKVKRHMQ